MGEIIIRIPEDVKEVVELNVSYKKVKEKLEELEQIQTREFLNFIIENSGKLKGEDIPPEEKVYLQED